MQTHCASCGDTKGCASKTCTKRESDIAIRLPRHLLYISNIHDAGTKCNTQFMEKIHGLFARFLSNPTKSCRLFSFHHSFPLIWCITYHFSTELSTKTPVLTQDISTKLFPDTTDCGFIFQFFANCIVFHNLFTIFFSFYGYSGFYLTLLQPLWLNHTISAYGAAPQACQKSSSLHFF